MDTQPPEAGDTLPPADQHAQELESDLKALYAIRDAAMSPDETRPTPDGKPL
ncbi:MAG: hypothetical protein ABIU58_05120 [Ramlibacter sp.]